MIMKKKCENPNGKFNMATIKDSKSRKAIKFNSLDKAKAYLKSKSYRFREAHNHKEERCMFYSSWKFGWVKVSSCKDYLNDTTMEQGTVWKIIKI
tara:strand:+ start:444 stop:728 length:285 start_codon:yes stop_codon:yes gene_type:complete